MVASGVVAVGAVLFAVTIVMAIWKAWRTRGARSRLEEMYAAAHHPSRRLVEVLKPLHCARTGDHLVVLDVRTGEQSTMWLPLQSLPAGDLALVVWVRGQWVLMDQLDASRVRRATAQADPRRRHRR